MIRGAVYQVDLGNARGHEQRGKRLGVAVSPTNMPWSVATVVPTSTSARASMFRPSLDILGENTRVLCDQIRTIDIDFLGEEPVDYLTRDQIADVDYALARYLGLVPDHPDDVVASADEGDSSTTDVG